MFIKIIDFITLLFLFLSLTTSLLAHSNSRPEAAQWMEKQINRDLAYFKDKTISISETRNYFNTLLGSFVEATIQNNRLAIKAAQPQILSHPRLKSIENAFRILCRNYQMPNVTFFIELGDATRGDFPYPLFVMAKNRRWERQILFPDFDALKGAYQVIPNCDLERATFPWEWKINQLSWRGSTAQGEVTKENMYSLSRVILCQLSLEIPQIIDAKFTLFCQGGEKIPELRQFSGNHLSYLRLAQYKFQILLDGNTSSYSASGWKFFINSVVIIPQSENIQWYYAALQPFEHYIPVRADLSDLVPTLEWLRREDAYAKQIASNGLEFARSHITATKNILYLYHLLWKYSELNFIH